MVSQYEASMLQRDMRNELDGPSRAVQKCAAGLALLALIAAFGTYPVPNTTLDVAEGPVTLADYALRPLPERE